MTEPAFTSGLFFQLILFRCMDIHSFRAHKSASWFPVSSAVCTPCRLDDRRKWLELSMSFSLALKLLASRSVQFCAGRHVWRIRGKPRPRGRRWRGPGRSGEPDPHDEATAPRCRIDAGHVFIAFLRGGQSWGRNRGSNYGPVAIGYARMSASARLAGVPGRYSYVR